MRVHVRVCVCDYNYMNIRCSELYQLLCKHNALLRRKVQQTELTPVERRTDMDF